MRDYCTRCGECCKLPSGKYCRFCIKVGKIFHCRIYQNRLGAYIGEGCYCNDIHTLLEIKDIPTCPYSDNFKEDG